MIVLNCVTYGWNESSKPAHNKESMPRFPLKSSRKLEICHFDLLSILTWNYHHSSIHDDFIASNGILALLNPFGDVINDDLQSNTSAFDGLWWWNKMQIGGWSWHWSLSMVLQLKTICTNHRKHGLELYASLTRSPKAWMAWLVLFLRRTSIYPDWVPQILGHLHILSDALLLYTLFEFQNKSFFSAAVSTASILSDMGISFSSPDIPDV